MATRAEIRAKHGVVIIESPDIANEELSVEEAEMYEDFISYLISRSKHASERKQKEDKLVRLVKLHVADLSDKQLEHSLDFFKKLHKQSCDQSTV